ncbi:hypothetical protein CJJ23_02240 [Mycoplasmopsis agassizii]|uniref:Uncharacterized protein n=1 Tax=Mycoplasmopsis agassizii TaxID=33922 RepID=A0A269TJ16_9BACT|nr:hypothetical protein [Mycoplasmopsis agassizii]PAK21444.1 hypothetical protein CJJ23_02240 [Mycoplasmopsis agassizii]
MAKSNKRNLADELREIDHKLSIIRDENFISREEWVRSPDFEVNYKKPEKARISNWGSKEEFYDTYNQSDPRAKAQLFRMTQRILSLNSSSQEKKPYKKTLSKKNFLQYLFIVSLAFLVLIIAGVTFVFASSRHTLISSTNNNVPFILIATVVLLFGIAFSLYILLRTNRILAYKNVWIKTYFGKWWNPKNVAFAFSNQEAINKITSLKSTEVLDVFPDIFSEQDFLNFRVLFFREFYFYEAINPAYKFKSRYKFYSRNFLIATAFLAVFIIGAVVLFALI